MRLYGAIEKVEAQADGTVRVHGIATTEAVDDQGEIVRSDAIRAAIPDYMKFPAVREMHQLSAAGTALELAVGDDKVTRLVAHVVDPVAVAKVKNQVYRGFSIGGRVTQREAGNPKTITGLVLNEISLVDRPANPEAIFDVWKASSMAGPPAINPPIQVWSCGDTAHLHMTKADATACLEKRALAKQADTLTASVPANALADGDLAKTLTEADIAAVIKHGAETGASAMQSAMDAALQAIAAGRVELEQPVGKAVDTSLDTSGSVADRGAQPLAKDGGDGDDMAEADKAGDAPGDGSKPYGDVEYADPGYQSDGKKRYPLNTAKRIEAGWRYINMPKNAGKYSAGDLKAVKDKIVAAWKDKIDKDGPPSASEKASRADIAKSLWDIGEVAMMVGSLRSLHERLEFEAALEGDESSAPAKARDLCMQLCQFLRDLVAEETSEVLDGDEIDGPVAAMPPLALSSIAECLRKSIPDQQRAEALVTTLYKAGAKHNARDQALLDVAATAMSKAMNMASCTKADRMHLAEAHKAVLDNGATDLGADGREMLEDSNPEQGAGAATDHATQDTSDNAETTAPNPTGASPAKPVPAKVDKSGSVGALEIIEAILAGSGVAVEKAGPGHRPLMEIAHHCINAVSDGAVCKADGAKPARHSGATMALLDKAHFHLTKCGGMEMACKASNALPGGSLSPAGEAEGEGTNEDTAKQAAAAAANAAGPTTLTEPQANPALDQLLKTVVTLTETTQALLTQNGEMRKRIEDIAATPVPPKALARTAGLGGLSKVQDGAGGDPAGPVDVTDALAQMSDEEITKSLIKRSFRNPMKVHGFTDGPGPMRHTALHN
jgi:hypothetical protein